MLSMRELEVFRRVMELGTITAAAEMLHISQPAVSRTLQQAERRLGFPLFLRRKKRLLAQLYSSLSLPRRRRERMGLPDSFAAALACSRSVNQ